MHVSEQRSEVAQCLQAQGSTPFAWISDLVPVDQRWCLIHATHLTPAERDLAADRGAVVGLCPTSEANLGDGIFDFADWYARGAPWGIGGDSHVSVSPFAELRALESSQRLQLGRRNVAATRAAPDVAANLWRGAAAGGAQALGQPMGRLEAGMRADLVVLDGDMPDCESLQAAAILGIATFGNSGRVRTVLVGGRVVVEDGAHPDEHEARDAYRLSLRRLRAAP
jgi:formimidoylglutamate deiminase